MDVKNLNQNSISYNQYNANNVSDYSENREEVTIQPVEKVEQQSLNLDNAKNKENKEIDKKELDKALKKINNFLKDEHTHAEYSVHKDLNAIMIKIVDEDTKEVILEVPPKKILDMVASMCKQVGLLDKKA
jgi:Uncharacterized flagellar protein FlaG